MKWFGRKKKLYRGEFLRMMADRFTASGMKIASVDESEFLIRHEEGAVTYLSNTFERYSRAEPADEEVVIRQLLDAGVPSSSLPQTFAAAAPNILPAVKASSYASLISLDNHMGGPTAWDKTGSASGALTEGVDIYLVYDTEHSITFLSNQDLRNWEVTYEEALSHAIENLKRLTDPDQLLVDEDGVLYGRWGDSYESSRFLLTDWIRTLNFEGDPVCFIPSRNTFWLVDSTNREGITRLIKESEEFHFAPYSVAETPFVLRKHGWRPYAPEDTQAALDLERMKRERAGLDYGQQKESLDKLHNRDDIDIFVASYAELNRDGFICSVSVWTKGVSTMLPRTERILLLIDPEAKERILVNWTDLELVAGHRMRKDPVLKPERYFVEEFPSIEELEKLKELAV